MNKSVSSAKIVACVIGLLIHGALVVNAQVDQFWNATPNDVNNLLKSMKDMIGVNYNMQVKGLDEVTADASKNPILFRSGHYNYQYNDEQRKRLREYMLGGGMVVFNTGLGSAPFYRSTVKELAAIFPEQPLQRLTADHPIFHSYYDLDRVQYLPGVARSGYLGNEPWFDAIEINCRVVALVSRWCLAVGWEDYEKPEFQAYTADSAKKLGVNIFSYASAMRAWSKNAAQSIKFVDKEEAVADRVAMVQVEVQEDDMRLQSLFKAVGDADSRIHMLIGAKKFIEGWSSWRVSAMGLMNVGKGEGSQVIQLFGRGVRLKGRNKSLKRSAESAGQFCPTLKHLETLYIFGWNANFVENFRKTIETEDVPQKLGRTLRVKIAPDPLPRWLWVPVAPEGRDPRNETWVLDAKVESPVLDLAPRVRGVSADGTGPRTHDGVAGQSKDISFADDDHFGLLDCDALRASLLDYKTAHRYDNVFIGRDAVATVLRSRCTVRIPTSDASDPVALQEAAEHALRLYLDKFVRRMYRESETDNYEPRLLDRQRHVLSEYEIRVRAGDKEGKRLLKAIRELLEQDVEVLCQGYDANLPRLKFDRHLFNPVLTVGTDEWAKRVSVRPPALGGGEHLFVKDLSEFWKTNSGKSPYRDWEVYLLRNLPMIGIGLYSRSGFFPDFILWVRHRQTNTVHIRFLDPHGLHHEGLGNNQDRFDAIAKLPVLSQKPEFRTNQISMDAKLLVATELKDIPDRGDRGWPELQRDYPIVHQQDDGDYIKKVLNLVQ